MPVLASPPLVRGSRSGLGTVDGWAITSYFGNRPDPFTGRPSGHGGEDIAAPFGTPILAVVDGDLWQGWDVSGGGNWSGLTADDGSYFGFGHASAFADGGRHRRVKAGDVIAWVGSTGASTGAHLHFAYRPAGSRAYADPFVLLQATEGLVSLPVVDPDPPATFATVPFSTQQETDLMATPAFALSDGSHYACDGLQARWLYGEAYVGLSFGATPAVAQAVPLDRQTSIDFLRSFEGSGNIDAGAADRYAAANPA